MRYADVRERIKTGDLLLWSSDASGSTRHDIETEIVKLATRSQWTHAGVAWSEHGRVMVMDLTTRGCAPRPLSGDLPFWWIPAPRELGRAGLDYAFSRFGEMVYSRWQAITAVLRRLVVGDDLQGQCAEYVLEVYRADGMAPTDVATPAALMVGAMNNWPFAEMHRVVDDEPV